MLSRIANNLFWMGRYLERALHTSRYVNVHYFSTLDAPLLSKKEFVLDSISSMTGLSYEYADKAKDLEEQELIYRITLDEGNPVSIKSAITKARENARGTRDVLSSELWQSINKFYHRVNTYNKNKLTHDEVLEFTEMVVEQSLIVQGYIAHTLLHDHTWYLLRLGKHIEAAAQITRILIAKSKDIIAANQTELGKAVEIYQIITLLKTTEAFDMSRIHYKDVPNFTDTLEFLILNKEFPRSIHYSLESVHRSLQKIQLPSDDFKKSPEFFVGKKNSSFNYMTVEDIENEVLPFLERTLKDIYYMGELIIHKLS